MGCTGERGVGDILSTALNEIGITDDRVSRWLGRPCGCAERRERLNQLGFWARRVLYGKVAGAREHLDRILGEGP